MDVSSELLRDPKFIEEVAKEIFASADEDDSGFIDRDELTKFLSEYSAESGMPIPNPSEVDQIVLSIDKNNDNKFSLEEFTTFIKQVFNKIAETM